MSNAYQPLFQKAIFPALETLNRTSIRKKLEILNRSQWWSREEIEQYQKERLQEMIRHSYENVPYYNRLFQSLKLAPSDIRSKDDLRKLPILTKERIRQNPKEFVAGNLGRKLYTNFTSGTTYVPMKFLYDMETYSWVWALIFRAWECMGFQLGDKYMKLSIHERVSWEKKLQDFLLRDKYIYVHNLDEERIRRFIGAYEDFRPAILRSYSSSLFVIAKYLQKNGIELKHKLKGISTTGDNLFPVYRELIEKVFKCKIFDFYGCGGEMLEVAFQCERSGPYHLMEESVITEFGESEVKGSSELIITGLQNYAMPLIRYKTGDLVSNKECFCDCGRKSATLHSINGRNSDIIRTREGENLIMVFFASFLKYIESIEKFQIVQKDLDSIHLKLITNSKYSEEDERKIINMIKSAAPSLQIRIEYVDAIADARSGKPRFVISELSEL